MLKSASRYQIQILQNRWSVQYPKIQVKMENSLAVPEFTVRNLTPFCAIGTFLLQHVQ
jgi:hypothetical protein